MSQISRLDEESTSQITHPHSGDQEYVAILQQLPPSEWEQFADFVKDELGDRGRVSPAYSEVLRGFNDQAGPVRLESPIPDTVPNQPNREESHSQPNAHQTVGSNRRGKRKREPELGPLDHHKQEIIRLYKSAKYSVEDLIRHFQNKYGIFASEKQLRNRIDNWNARKRLKGHEYLELDMLIKVRQAEGKRSNISLDGQLVSASDAGFKKRMSRAIQGIPTLDRISMEMKLKSTQSTLLVPTLPNHVKVWTPASTPLGEASNALVQQRLPGKFMDNLPIVQAGVANLFKNILNQLQNENSSLRDRNPNLQLSPVRIQRYIVFLRMIIFQLSNNLVDAEGICDLLDRIDRRGYRGPWKEFLKQQGAVLIQAVCQNIMPWVIWRRDIEIFTLIWKSHPEVYICSHWDILKPLNLPCNAMNGRAIYQDFRQRLRALIVDRDLGQLSEKMGGPPFPELTPKAGSEAIDLLSLFGHELDAIDSFFGIWDRNQVSSEDLEVAFLSERRYISPFLHENEQTIRSLFEARLHFQWQLCFLEALLHDDIERIVVFLRYVPWNEMGLSSPLADREVGGTASHLEFENELTTHGHYWYLLPPSHFVKVIEATVPYTIKFIEDTKLKYTASKPEGETPFRGNEKQMVFTLVSRLVERKPIILSYIMEAAHLFNHMHPLETYDQDVARALASEITFRHFSGWGDFQAYSYSTTQIRVSPNGMGDFDRNQDRTLHALFGPTRLSLKAQIEILQELLKFGVDVNNLPHLKYNFWSEISEEHNCDHTRRLCGSSPKHHRAQGWANPLRVTSKCEDPGIHGYSVLDLFEMGFDIESPVQGWEYNFEEPIRREHDSRLPKTRTPIEFALTFETSEFFTYLLRRGAKTQVFKKGYRLMCHIDCGISDEFLTYIHIRSIPDIEARWGKRLIDVVPLGLQASPPQSVLESVVKSNIGLMKTAETIPTAQPPALVSSSGTSTDTFKSCHKRFWDAFDANDMDTAKSCAEDLKNYNVDFWTSLTIQTFVMSLGSKLYDDETDQKLENTKAWENLVKYISPTWKTCLLPFAEMACACTRTATCEHATPTITSKPDAGIMDLLRLILVNDDCVVIISAVLDLIPLEYQPQWIEAWVRHCGNKIEPHLTKKLGLLKLLHSRGLRISVADKSISRKSLIQCCMDRGCLNTFLYLLENNADIYAINDSNDTAVERAVLAGSIDFLAAMMGAHPNCKDLALEAAERFAKPAMVKYIKNWTPAESGQSESHSTEWQRHMQ